MPHCGHTSMPLLIAMLACESSAKFRVADSDSAIRINRAPTLIAVDVGIELSETAARPLGSVGAPLGVSPAPDGSLTIWSRGNPNVTVMEDARSTSFYAPSQRILAAYRATTHTIGVLGAGPDYVEDLRLSISGELISRNRVALTSPAASAARHRDAWFILTQDTARHLTVGRLESGSLRQIYSLPALYRSSHAYLSSSGAGIAVTLASWPFTHILISTSGELMQVVNPVEALVKLQKVDLRDWIALPRFTLDDRFFQTLADPRSTRRLLASGTHGTVHGARLIDVPLSLVAANAARNELIAVRTTDSIEIVTYRVREFTRAHRTY